MPDMPVTALSLRQHLMDLVSGEWTLAQFDEWLAIQTWDDSNVSLDARHLVSQIELVLAEYTSEHWTWSEARKLLTDLVYRAEVAWGVPTITTTGSTAAEVIRVAAPESRSAEANIQYAKVSV